MKPRILARLGAPTAIPFAGALLYICQYALLAQGFLWRYTDGDQMIVAEMAAYFARGVFPEPFVWGQNYLLPIEAYLSAPPLVSLGVPCPRPLSAVSGDVATLLVTAVLFYTPFLWGARLAAHRHPALGLAVLSTPILIDPAFPIVGLMPRGFMGAVGLAALGTLGFLQATRPGVRVACARLVGICGAAYPPSALVTAALLSGRVSRPESALHVLALAAGVSWVAWLGQHYELVPRAVVHRQWATEISAATLVVTGQRPADLRLLPFERPLRHQDDVRSPDVVHRDGWRPEALRDPAPDEPRPACMGRSARSTEIPHDICDRSACSCC